MRVGLTELLVVFIVALFVVGPDKLPEYARKLGEALAQLRKISDDATKDIKESIVEPLNEAQKPLREAMEPLQDLDKTVQKNVNDLKKSMSDLGKTPKSNGRSDKETSSGQTVIAQSDVVKETVVQADTLKADTGSGAEKIQIETIDNQENLYGKETS
ncbi:MAG: twin-arginine translocase TatA/TatE family subunit [Blautia sp.]|nr:twin-arginine translocase TatA/TatE family subunit [Blautia sp.]